MFVLCYLKTKGLEKLINRRF